MKNSELVILEVYLANWISCLNKEVEYFANLSSIYNKQYIDNIFETDLNKKIEINVNLIHLSDNAIQQISKIAFVKSHVYNMIDVVHRSIEKDQETIPAPKFSEVKSYVFEKLLFDFLSLLEVLEMFEECGTLNRKICAANLCEAA